MLEARRGSSPVNIMQLLDLINQSRPSPIHPNNFRTSIHTLCKNQYLDKFRNASLMLAVQLTEKGKMKAGEIFHERDIADTGAEHD
ncbi:chromosome segregation protein ParM [Aeromonas salmonicida]|uniref:chromosome segregation protein ParM n=1 Tax=Aeromonas salmonicida TaxID=645 RepID=UPI001CEC4BE8|nr:chromosome segregation protein ParM [Aeromonas salmonicida]